MSTPTKLKIGDQSFRLGNVMALTTRQKKAQGVSQAIHVHMDFGAEATATASQGLFGISTVFFETPAAQGWALITCYPG